MPRRKLSRRFEPRLGVSEHTIKRETGWMVRELEDHLILSTQDLHDRLRMRHTKLVASDANLQMLVESLPERDSLAIRCMLARDLFHVFALYEEFFRNHVGERAVISISAQQQATDKIHSHAPTPSTPGDFKEWLFESE